MRRQACAHQVGWDQAVQLPHRLCHDPFGAVGGEADQFVKHDPCQGASGKRIECHQRVADIAHDRGAAGQGFGDGGFDAAHDLGGLRIGTLPPRRDDTANPADEIGRRIDLIPKVGQLEMGVGVHHAREDRHVAEVELALGVAGRGTPVGDDPPAIDRHPPIPDGRLADRDEPPRAVANQWEMTRSCLPERLRAG